MLGNLLRIGVLLSAAVVLAGGVLFLIRHGTEPAEHQVFHGEPAELRSRGGDGAGGTGRQRRGLIQLGLLLLVATPVARVVFSMFAFARQRDFTYVAITLVVLLVLLYSLTYGE